MTTFHITRDAISEAAQKSYIPFSVQVRQDNGSYKDTLDIIAIVDGYAFAKTHRTGVIARVTTKEERNENDWVDGWRTQYGWAVTARVVFATDTGDAAGTLEFDDANAHPARININLARQFG